MHVSFRCIVCGNEQRVGVYIQRLSNQSDSFFHRALSLAALNL